MVVKDISLLIMFLSFILIYSCWQTFNHKMKIILSLLLIMLLQSCSLEKYRKLTREEKAYIESQSFFNDCEITFEKDYNVIQNDSSNGLLYIRLEFASSKNKLCLYDSAHVAKIILPFAKGFEKIMDKRLQYDSLKIETSIMNRETKGMEFQTCGKYFEFNLNNMKSFKYREFINIERK